MLQFIWKHLPPKDRANSKVKKVDSYLVIIFISCTTHREVGVT